MSVQVPSGVVKLAWSLTEKTPNIELSAGVADVETEVVGFQIPRNCSIAVKKGDKLYIYLASVTPTEIAEDSIIRVYLADANKTTKFKVLEARYGELKNLTGYEEQIFRFRQGFARGEDEFILITADADLAIDSAQTLLRLQGTQFIKI